MVMRRTSLGQFGKAGPAALETVADMMAAHLGWNADRRAAEIAGLDRVYRVTP